MTGNIFVTESQGGAAPRRRPGRPQLSETSQETPSEEARRTRMRLAQRSYRSRRQSALISAKARAEILEVALDGSIDEFINFYEHASQRGTELPAGLMAQLTQTAMNIVSIARRARSEKSMGGGDTNQALDGDEAETAEETDAGHEPMGKPLCDPADRAQITAFQTQTRPYEPLASGKQAPVSQRFMLACLTKAISLLQQGNLTTAALTPAMLLPLQLERAERLLERVAHRLSGSPSAVSADSQYSYGRNLYLPKMMRLIEGNLNTLTPRSSPPNLQSFQLGRTRTMLHTAISDLQGEWLEAPDVEEYLEQRGIFVRMGSPSDIISLSTPVCGDVLLPAPSALNMQISHGMIGSQSQAREDTSEHPKAARPYSALSTPKSQFYLFGGHNTYGGLSQRHVPRPEHDFTIFGKVLLDGQTVPTGHSNVPPSKSFAETRSEPDGGASSLQAQDSLKITINIDRLIQGLADKAVCLGLCPGIKRVHVDEAIRGSVSDSQQILVSSVRKI